MKITLVGLAVRYIRNHRKIAKHTFYVGTYAVATVLAIVESGHVTEGIVLGLVGGTVKIGWHFAHKTVFVHSH